MGTVCSQASSLELIVFSVSLAGTLLQSSEWAPYCLSVRHSPKYSAKYSAKSPKSQVSEPQVPSQVSSPQYPHPNTPSSKCPTIHYEHLRLSYRDLLLLILRLGGASGGSWNFDGV